MHNPNGPPKAKTQFYRYVCKYLSMTPKQIKAIDKDGLTLSQRGALKTALKIADGEWSQIREIIERDEGKVTEHMTIEHGVMPADEAAGVLGMLDERKARN